MTRGVRLVGVTLCVLLPYAGLGAAQGSAVYTHSACMTARAAAGIADPCDDGSAIFYNPAAIALTGSVASIGVTGVRTGGSFIYDHSGDRVDRVTATTPVPQGWLSLRATDRLALGLGVWAPYGLGVEWPHAFEGAFVGHDNSLQAIYVQPTLAVQLVPGFLSVGAGLDVVRGSVGIHQHVDLAAQEAQPGVTFGQLGVPSGSRFADASLEGSGTGLTWHVGVQARTAWLSAGWRYLHRVRVPMEGSAAFRQLQTGLVLPPANPVGFPGGTSIDLLVAPQFQPGGPLTAQGITSEITFPSQFVAGIRLRPVPELSIFADYQLTGWDTFDEVEIGFERAPDQSLILDYRDASTIRLGADLRVSEALNLRGGWIYNTAATPAETVTPLLPEAERNYVAVGLGYHLTDRMSLDLGYQHIIQGDRRGRVRPRPSRDLPAEALNAGVFTGTGQVFGATLAYRFGRPRPD